MFDNQENDLFPFIIPNSKLPSLFGQTINQLAPNNNLVLNTPKPNKFHEHRRVKLASFNTIIKKQVRAIKLTEEKNILEGNCHLAVIDKDFKYQLVLYKHQNNIMSRTEISKYFKFNVEHDNYASFCDDSKSHWRVHFSNKSDILDFADALTVRYVNSSMLEKKRRKIRMAKMGDQIKSANYKNNRTENDSDQVMHSYLSKRKLKTDEITQNPMNMSEQHSKVNEQYFPLLLPLVNPSPIASSRHTMPPLESSSPIMSIPAYFSDQLNVFFAENRTHNTEMRMSVVRLTTKMEEIMDKFTRLDQRPEQTNQRAEDTLNQNLNKNQYLIEEMDKNREQKIKTEETELSESAKEHVDKNMEHLELIHKLQCEITEQNKVMNKMKMEKFKLEKKVMGIINKIKQTMDDLYNIITSDVKQENMYSVVEMKAILASRIRQSTFKIISLFEDLNMSIGNNVSVKIEK